MAPMGSKVATLLLLLNFIFFTSVSSHCVQCPRPPVPCKSPPIKPPPIKPPPIKPPPIKPPPIKPPPIEPAKCPKDILKLAVCADLLGGLVNIPALGTPSNSPCCALLTGLTNLEAALCLCTAIKANVLGIIKLDVPIAISLLVNTCGKKVPEGFQCA